MEEEFEKQTFQKLVDFRGPYRKLSVRAGAGKGLLWSYQITYDYTVEVTNSFKEVDLKECLINYGCRFVTLYRRQ